MNSRARRIQARAEERAQAKASRIRKTPMKVPDHIARIKGYERKNDEPHEV